MFCRLHNSPLIGQRNSFMDRSGCFLPRPTLIHGLLCDSNADIVLLQETWLLKRDLGVLATLHKKYLGNGKSAIPDDTILHVRPYGGLGFLWRRSLTGNIRNIHVNCYRIDAILLTHDGSVTLIVNVYLPVDNRQMQHVSPEFSECIDALEIVINEHSYHHVIIGGDFNTDFSRNNAQSKYLKHFLERNALMNVWDLPCADKNDTTTGIVYTYKSSETRSSCIDYFFTGYDGIAAVKSATPLDTLSSLPELGHVPILAELSYGEVCADSHQQDNCDTNALKFEWHKITDYGGYQETLNSLLASALCLYDTPAFHCKDRMCRDIYHLKQIDEMCKLLTDMCVSSAEHTLPVKNARKGIPCWNADIKPLKETADFWGRVWKDCGRPTHGVVVDFSADAAEIIIMPSGLRNRGMNNYAGKEWQRAWRQTAPGTSGGRYKKWNHSPRLRHPILMDIRTPVILPTCFETNIRSCLIAYHLILVMYMIFLMRRWDVMMLVTMILLLE